MNAQSNFLHRTSPRPAPVSLLYTLAMLVFALTFALPVQRAEAHAFAATDAIVSFDRNAKSFGMLFDINIEAILAGVDPEVKDTNESPKAQEYNRLRALPPAELQKEFEAFEPQLLAGMRFFVDGKPIQPKLVSVKFAEIGDLGVARKTSMQFQGDLPPDSKTFAFGWQPTFGKILLRTIAPHARAEHVEKIEAGATSSDIVIDDVKSRTTIDMVWDFLKIGYTHILPKGTDHILFVVGIFLLSTKLKPILTQITAFTVAHTITLGLGAAGYVYVPPSIVEPLIAASIVYVGVENIMRPTLSFWRPFVVFCFGLLHGMGFAGILREFSIPKEDFLIGLLSFNVGVELGQLTIIAFMFLTVGIWFGNKPWYRQRIVIPGSAIISVIAAFWFFQRIGLFG